MKCRHCSASLEHTFIDLGFAPPSNAYLRSEDLSRPEHYYPLRVKVCERCWLVQTEDYNQAEELFRSDYAYFSSTSTGWLNHASRYTEKMIRQFGLSQDSFVIEIASNDGYLLKNFVQAKVPSLGIEPTASTADAAEKLGIPVLREFFGEQLGKRLAVEGKKADLIVGNNVYAHVPDINDFTRGMKAILKPEGIITLEFPHLMRLIEKNQFDTIYHEHFSYLSLYTVSLIFEVSGLTVWDVEELPTHGGSLRIYGCHCEDQRKVTSRYKELLQNEKLAGLQDLKIYKEFQLKANRVKNDLLAFLIEQKEQGKNVVAYGAAAKGNTLLNYAGIKPDLLPLVFDAALAKQGKFLPGSHIPILPADQLNEHKPDFLLILPWNIAPEVRAATLQLLKFNTKYVKAVPELVIE